jgi:hypothetical protein
LSANRGAHQHGDKLARGVTKAYRDTRTTGRASNTALTTLSLLTSLSVNAILAIQTGRSLLARWTRGSRYGLHIVDVISELFVLLEHIRFHVTEVIEDGLLKLLHVHIERLLLLCRPAINT